MANHKLWRQYKNTKSWKQVKTAFEKRYCQGVEKSTPSYYLEKVNPQYQGEYIHPKLVHFVAEYCSVEYAFIVAELMDSINDKVHEALKDKQLDDTVENAKPVFNDIVKSIAPSIKTSFEENYCYGVRDRIDTLDQYERDDLNRVVNEYKAIKERLHDVEKKVDEWGAFVHQYHPEFEK